MFRRQLLALFAACVIYVFVPFFAEHCGLTFSKKFKLRRHILLTHGILVPVSEVTTLSSDENNVSSSANPSAFTMCSSNRGTITRTEKSHSSLDSISDAQVKDKSNPVDHSEPGSAGRVMDNPFHTPTDVVTSVDEATEQQTPCNVDIPDGLGETNPNQLVDKISSDNEASENGNLKCPYGCETVFLCFSALSRHLRTHIRPKGHQCDTCSMTFSRYAELIKHRIAVHPKKHICRHCGKHFTRARNVKLHQKLKHNDIEKEAHLFFCSIPGCGATFCKQSNLRNHWRHKHNPEGMAVVCNKCGKSFAWEHSLKKHIATVHSPTNTSPDSGHNSISGDVCCQESVFVKDEPASADCPADTDDRTLCDPNSNLLPIDGGSEKLASLQTVAIHKPLPSNQLDRHCSQFCRRMSVVPDCGTEVPHVTNSTVTGNSIPKEMLDHLDTDQNVNNFHANYCPQIIGI
eukprot:GHVT01069638.1.p1 GENE.GHVT01069638.1~~GHVT01069638.1.p1  ORF type:complete len:460 (-),score=5.79 GHVT01069638.1:196-1575(-)